MIFSPNYYFVYVTSNTIHNLILDCQIIFLFFKKIMVIRITKRYPNNHYIIKLLATLSPLTQLIAIYQ